MTIKSRTRREASCWFAIKTAPIKKRISWMKDNWEELCGGHRDVEKYPSGSKSGPIFGNLYTMARWMCTQDSPLVRKGISSTLPLVNKRLGVRTNARRRSARRKKDYLRKRTKDGTRRGGSRESIFKGRGRLRTSLVDSLLFCQMSNAPAPWERLRRERER